MESFKEFFVCLFFRNWEGESKLLDWRGETDKKLYWLNTNLVDWKVKVDDISWVVINQHVCPVSDKDSNSQPIRHMQALLQANGTASRPSRRPSHPPNWAAVPHNDFINILPADQYLYWSSIVRVIRLKPRTAWSSEVGGAKERGCREDGERGRERVCSHSEREKRYKRKSLGERQTARWRQVRRQILEKAARPLGLRKKTNGNYFLISGVEGGGWLMSTTVSDRR